MTKIFPYDFDKKVKSFNVRFLPNLLSYGTLGDSIVIASKEKSSTLLNRESQIYLSHAIINPLDGFNSYLKEPISIVRYGKKTFDLITKQFLNLTNPFDLTNDISFIFSYKNDPKGFGYFEITDVINSNQNRIYDESHLGKNNKELIEDFLMRRDIRIESLALNLSSDKFKPEIMKSYGDIIRDHKIKSLLA